MMSPQYMKDAVHSFNALPRQHLILPQKVLNRWHISIRQISIQPQLHTVFLFQPDLLHCACQGRIEKGLGGFSGQSFDLTSPAATTVIARLIIDQFVGQLPSLGRPWSWATNDEALGKRLVDIMRRLGVEEFLLHMPLASVGDNQLADESWVQVARHTQFLVSDG